MYRDCSQFALSHLGFVTGARIANASRCLIVAKALQLLNGPCLHVRLEELSINLPPSAAASIAL